MTDDDPYAGRGRLQIRRRAVERLLAAAAAEVDAAGGPATRVLGQTVSGGDLDAAPRAHAAVAGDLVTVDLSVSVPWGEPVNEVADRVRAHVRDRLQALAGLQVAHVDIAVTALPLRGPSRRVVQ